MRAVRECGTRNSTSLSPSASDTAPPSRPVSATTCIPARCAASTAALTLGDAPEVLIASSTSPRLPKPLMDRLRADGLTVGDNLPYSGADEHGYSQHVHGDRRGLANALIEVRQDLIDTHHGAAEWAERLGPVLEEVLRDPELYKVEHYG